jgi:hypothetical protein
VDSALAGGRDIPDLTAWPLAGAGHPVRGFDA